MHTYTHVYSCTHAHMHACTPACMHAWHTCMHACMPCMHVFKFRRSGRSSVQKVVQVYRKCSSGVQVVQVYTHECMPCMDVVKYRGSGVQKFRCTDVQVA